MSEDIIAAFRASMIEAGIGAPNIIRADGEIHRFRGCGDKSGHDNCWYQLDLFPVVRGAYGSWRDRDIWETNWQPKGLPLTPEMQEKHRRFMAEMKRRHAAEQRKKHKETAIQAADVWKDSHAADAAHPYLVTKRVKPHGLRQYKDELRLPLYDVNLKLWSLLLIDPLGGKLFLKGGRVQGMFSPIGPLGEHEDLIICEGWATGATLHEETGQLVLAAMGTTNLLPVAKAVRKLSPSAKITIAADNDRFTEGNPGLTKGKAAAKAVGGHFIFPDFSDDQPGSDFNDFHNLHLGDGA